MAKKVITGGNGNDDPITEAEAKVMRESRRGGGRDMKYTSTPWHRRKQVVPVATKDVVTPNGGTATLIVDVRMADNSANAKIRAGRIGRNEDEDGNPIKDSTTGEEIVKINSMDYWLNDVPELLTMIKAQYNAAQSMLLEEAKRRLAEKEQSIVLL